MANNEKKIIDSEAIETTEIQETDELEFVSSEDDVKDYPAPEADEVKMIEATIEAESKNIIKDEYDEEIEEEDDDDGVEASPRYLIKLVLC